MQGTNSRFVANIVPLQNVQTNISGQGVQQTILTNISGLQSSVAVLTTAVSTLQTIVAGLQVSIAALEAKLG